MADSAAIVQRLWNYCNVLRDDGMSYGDYVEQLTYLLFLKMDDEQVQLLGKPSAIPAEYGWQSLLGLHGDELESHYRHILAALGTGSGLTPVIFRKAQNRIQDPAELRRLIVDLIDEQSWMTLDAAKKLLAACGQDFDALKKSAITKEFRPEVLDTKANIDIKQQLRSFKSHNVIGKLEGSDPKLRDEYIIYTAHWDHLGLNHNLQGDQIYNGAVDNASGVASLIQLASAFAKLNPPPKRSVLFMATTAEEAGLLGSKFYALRPLYPLEKTLADINIDTVNPWGKTRDIEDLSNNNSTLDDLLTAAAKRNGRVTQPNSQPEKGGFYRADHFEFSKRGVPALYTGGGKDFIGKPADFGQQKKDDYIAHHYHQVSDEVNSNWDLSGAEQDIQLLFEVGYQVANGDKFPEWKPESEFKGKRDEMLKR